MGPVNNLLPNRSSRPGVWFSLLRVDQYVKNLFVFLPPFFAGRMMEFQVLGVVVPSFIVLCLLASGVYVFNDLRDIEEDRSHPIKSRRPLPSGEVSPGKAKALAAGLFLTGFGLAAVESLRIRSWELFLLFCAYVFINVLYTHWLKRFAILDVAIIAVGFVIRIVLGAVSSAVLFSNWILMMTFLLALFLGFGKRRDDLVLLEDDAVRIRKSAAGYSLAFLDAAMVMMGSIVVVAYIMYTVSPEVMARFATDRLYLTTVFVVLGILRYLQITFIERNSGSPTQILLKDHFLQIVVAGWISSFLLILYVK
jgi:decaprenyl-phosphate phosphoribosyltransferase